jgi:hypothetical protein
MDLKIIIKNMWFWVIVVIVLIILFFPMFNCNAYGFPGSLESGPVGVHCQSLVDLLIRGPVYVE